MTQQPIRMPWMAIRPDGAKIYTRTPGPTAAVNRAAGLAEDCQTWEVTADVQHGHMWWTYTAPSGEQYRVTRMEPSDDPGDLPG